MSEPIIRATTAGDATQVLALYRAAAGGSGGLARRPEEMDLAYVEGFLAKAHAGGVSLGAWIDGRLAGEIHASRIGPDQFAHVLSDLTVAVDPVTVIFVVAVLSAYPDLDTTTLAVLTPGVV